MQVRMQHLASGGLLVVWACWSGTAAAYAEKDELASEARIVAQASKDDPAAPLFGQARGELNRSNFRQAAELFAQVYQRYPQSAQAADAYYWRAFALYKRGEDANYRTALEVLEEQKSLFPNAPTRKEADALATRINGMLARGGDSEAVKKITELAGKPQAKPSRTDDVDEEIRLEALSALMQMNSEQAVPILKGILAKRDAKSESLRERAVFILSQQPGEDTVDLLVDVANNDPSSDVREKAVSWLAQVPGDRSLAALTNVLHNSKDPDLREKAVFGLSQHESPKAAAMLQDLALDSKQDEELRQKAIFWISQRDGSFEFLRGLYDKLDSQELKDKTIFAIAQRDDAGSRDWLMQRATKADEGIELRKKALFWLGQEKELSAAEVRQLYTRFTEPEMKEQVIFVMSQRGGSEAVDFLMDIVKNEKNPELRKKAVFWLGQSGDPRAAKLLEELINQ